MPEEPLTLRKLTREQAKLKQHLCWSRKSIPERLAAGAALTKRLYRMQDIDIDEQQADLTPHSIPRSRR
jgi:hypothetical protein